MSSSTCRLLGGGTTVLGLVALAYGVIHTADTTLVTDALGKLTASIMMLGLLLVLGGGMTLLGHRR